MARKKKTGFRPVASRAKITPAQAKAYGARMTELAEQHGGLTPPVVVRDAEDPESVYHGEFEWDNDKAGPRWRLFQARNLIRTIEIVYEDEEGDAQHIPAFHSVVVETVDDEGVTSERRYVPTTRLNSDEDLRNQVISALLRRLRSIKRELKGVRGLEGVAKILTEAELSLMEQA